LLTLEAALRQRVLGQDHALRAVASAMEVSGAHLADPRKPVAVFMLVGPSGVGKTETALALADQLYGGPQSLTTINLSEFKEEHKVSMLVGSPAGYVGYGEGGVLTEAVRRRPHGVLLLDEVEKAHPGVQDVFYQVFDKGSLRDGEGRDIDFRHTTILMTSNVGTDLITALAADPDTAPAAEALEELLRPELLKAFKPAFLGRITVIPYLPLSDAVLLGVVRLQLGRLEQRVRDVHGATLLVDEGVEDFIAARARNSASGARAVEQLIARQVLPNLSRLFLHALADGRLPERITLDADAEGLHLAATPRPDAGPTAPDLAPVATDAGP
ncbi:MAG: AAA family ATPase, partial [Oxalobacteraceae bacterium]